jgi:hypothetical protein
MKQLPKTLTLRDIPGNNVDWRVIKTAEDKNGDPVEIYMPVPRLINIVGVEEIYQNIYAKKVNGDCVKMTVEDLLGAEVSRGDVQEEMNYDDLRLKLKAEGLEASEDDLRIEATSMGRKFWDTKEHLDTLKQKAWQIPEPEHEEELPEPDEPLTKSTFKEALREDEERKRKPWLYMEPKDMTDEEFALTLKAQREAVSRGEVLETYKTKPQPKPILPEPIEEQPPVEEPEDKSLFGKDKNIKKPIEDMNQEEFEEHVKKLADEANKRT